MTDTRLCDECKTVAPGDEAVGWWRVEAATEVLRFGDKTHYDFCSWRCMADYAVRKLAVT